MIEARIRVWALAWSAVFAPIFASGQQSDRRGPAHLTLDAPVARWDDGVPLGNGVLGALVWGERNLVRISLDRADLWDERLPETLKRADWTYATMKELVAKGDAARLHELFDVPYDTVAYPTKLPVGRIELTFPERESARRFELDLERAEARVTFESTTVRAIAVADRALIVVRVDGSVPDVRLVAPAGVAKLAYEAASVGSDANAKWYVQKAADGIAYAVVCTRSVDPNGATFAIHVGRALAGGDPLPDARRAATLESSETCAQLLEREHAAHWRRVWNTSRVDVPDARVQAQYDLARYVYAAGSRLDALGRGGAPIPLQGLWTADEGGLPPWKGDYHNDLNTQTTYIAYGPMGLFDEGETFLRYLSELTPTFTRFAREFYGVEGLIVPGVMTLEGRATGGWGQYSLSPTNTAWLAQLFEQHWRVTQDRVFLEQTAYPWCAAAGRAMSALLVANEAGKLRLPLSSSPEIFDNSMRAWMPPNSNYDQALLRYAFEALVDMARSLGKNAEVERWSAVLARLEPLDVDATTGSFTFARGVPYAESHRHFSHAMAIHPLGIVDIEASEAERTLIQATLAEIEKHGTDWWTGYSFSWFACLQARAARGEKALEYLEKYLSFTGRNGFHLNGDQSGRGLSKFTYRPFTLEGNMLAAQAVHEMLLQSWGGVVRVFPAVSARWSDVRFDGLRAEGGWIVSARREGGVTRFVEVHSASGGRLVLRDPFGGAEPESNLGPLTRDGDDFVITLKAGEKLELGRGQQRDRR